MISSKYLGNKPIMGRSSYIITDLDINSMNTERTELGKLLSSTSGSSCSEFCGLWGTVEICSCVRSFLKNTGRVIYLNLSFCSWAPIPSCVSSHRSLSKSERSSSSILSPLTALCNLFNETGNVAGKLGKSFICRDSWEFDLCLEEPSSLSTEMTRLELMSIKWPIS